MTLSEIVSITVVVVASAILIALLLPRGHAGVVPTEPMRPSMPPALSTAPDPPKSFGPKVAWFAIRTDDPSAVIEALELSDVVDANWETGLEASYLAGTFVTPPVDGWVFAVGVDRLNAIVDESLRSSLASLAERFPDVQFFATYRVVELHGWARARNGAIERVYAYVGESGEVVVDEGERTPDELALAQARAWDPSADDAFVPVERDVFELASRWGLDPGTLDDRDLPPGVGWYGR